MKKSVTVVAAVLAGTLGMMPAIAPVAFGVETKTNAPNAAYPAYRLHKSPAITDLFKLGHYTGSDDPEADPYAKFAEASSDAYAKAAEYADTFDPAAISTEMNAAIFNVIGGDSAVCHEIIPMAFIEYNKGDALNVKATFPVDYKYLLCEKVAVYISVMDDDGGVTTYVVEGTVTDQGVVQFHINADCAKAIAGGTAYAAIFNAE